MKYVFSCLLDNKPKYMMQSYIWVNTLMEFAKINADSIFIHTVDVTDSDYFSWIKRVGARHERAERFDSRHLYCNKLSQLKTFEERKDFDYVFLMDCDTVIMEPIHAAFDGMIYAKSVDNPNPEPKVLLNIIKRANEFQRKHHRSLLGEEVLTGCSSFEYLGTSATDRNNCNGGVYIIHRDFIAILAEKWRKWALWCIDNIQLFDEYHIFADQVSFSLAMRELRKDTSLLDITWNYPLRFTTPSPNVTPKIVHYHNWIKKNYQIPLFNLSRVDEKVKKINLFIMQLFQNEPFMKTLFDKLFTSTSLEVHERNMASIKLQAIVRGFFSRKKHSLVPPCSTHGIKNFSLYFSSIPIVDNIKLLSSRQLEELMEIGCFYIKIPNLKMFHENFSALRKDALSMFMNERQIDRSPSTMTSEVTSVNKGVINTDYHDRRFDYENLETLRYFINSNRNQLLDTSHTTINALNTLLINQIAKEVMKLSFGLLACNDKDNKEKINTMIEDLSISILSFSYYSIMNYFDFMRLGARFRPHKDNCLIAILILEKPGLLLWKDGHWISILPKEGYVVALFGNEAEKATNGKICARVHMVTLNNNEERLSTVFFLAGREFIPFLSKNGDEFYGSISNFDIRSSKHEKEDRPVIKRGFTKLMYWMNLTYLFLSFCFMSMTIGYNYKKHSYESIFETLFKINEYFYSAALVFSGLLLTNLFLQIFKRTHFETIAMDYMQNTECSSCASFEQVKAYNIGKNSLSFFGIIKSFSESSTYTHKNFWNAGLMHSLGSQIPEKMGTRTHEISLK